MTNAKHTPGPWNIDAEERDYILISADWNTLAITVSNAYEIHEREHPELAEEGREIMKANARLIAAAPDMKEALDDFPDVHDGRMSNDELMEAVRDWYANQARPAIAKAEGK